MQIGGLGAMTTFNIIAKELCEYTSLIFTQLNTYGNYDSLLWHSIEYQFTNLIVCNNS